MRGAWHVVAVLVLCAHACVAVCPNNNEDLTDPEGVMRSQPEGDTYYADGEACQWTVAPPARDGMCVQLFADEFHVEDGYDFVTVMEPNGKTHEVSGDYGIIGFRLNTTAPVVTVRFTSDASETETGFVLHYRLVECVPDHSDCGVLQRAIDPDVGALLRLSSCCREDIFQWFGQSMHLTCDHEDHILELSLSNFGAAALSNPGELVHLKHLHTLEVNMGSMLPSIGPSVRTLHIVSQAGLTHLPALPDGLEVLHLGELPALADAWLESPPSALRELFLDGVGGSTLDMDLSGLTSVKKVTLRHLAATSTPVFPPHVEDVTVTSSHFDVASALPTSLRRVTLSNVGLNALPDAWPEHLEYLDVSRNNITRVPMLPASLQVLDVSGNALEELPAVRAPCALHKLTAVANRIRSVNALVTACPLEELDVAHNAIAELPALPQSLNVLNVVGNTVRTLGGLPAHMKELRIPGVAQMPRVLPSELEVLDVSDVPAEHLNVTASQHTLTTLHAARCGLVAFPFADWPHNLVDVNIAENKLTSIPALACENCMVNVSYNALEHIEGLGYLTWFDAQHNQLRSIGNPTSANQDVNADTILNLSHNQLTSLPPLLAGDYLDVSHNHLTELIAMSHWTLDCSYNQIRVLDVCSAKHMVCTNNLIEDVDCTTTTTGALTAVLDHNNLGDISHVMHAFRPSESVSLRHNPLSGRLGDGVVAPNMVHLDVSHTTLTGPLLNLHAFPRIMLLEAENTTMHDTAQPECWDTPETCHFASGLELRSMSVGEDPSQQCPVLQATGRTVTLLMNWRQYTEARMCKCVWGYFGDVGECAPCPTGAMCEEERIEGERGHFVHAECAVPGATHEDRVLRCPTSHTDVCAPDGTVDEFFERHAGGEVASVECTRGYTGRMCLTCERGYHRWGSLCRKCLVSGMLALVMFLVVLVFAVLVYSAYTCKEASTGAVKILVFLAQMMQMLGSTGSSLNTGLMDAAQSFNSFMLQVPGIECYVHNLDFVRRTWGMLAVPWLLLALCALVYAAGRVYMYWNPPGGASAGLEQWWNKNVRAFLFLLLMVYLPISTSIMSALTCDRDACTGETYFHNAQSVLCNTRAAAGVRAAAGAAVVWFVVGVPALFAWLSLRTHVQKIGTSNLLDFLLGSYTSELWWWEGVVTLRKLFIVATVSFVAHTSVWSALSIVGVLFVSTVVQDYWQPFRNALDNKLEYGTLCVSTICFACSVAFHVPDADVGAGASAVIASLLYIAFFSVAVIIVFPKLRERKSALVSMRQSERVSLLEE